MPQQVTHTLPKTNIAPTNGWLEYYFLLGRLIFRGYVSFREGTYFKKNITIQTNLDTSQMPRRMESLQPALMCIFLENKPSFSLRSICLIGC